MGVLHALRVKSPYKLLRIEDIKIDNKPNEHGYLYLKCLIDDSIKFQSAINASASDKICVYEKAEDENLRESSVNINVVNKSKSKILFNGMINSIKTTNNNGVYYLEIEGITWSFELDIKEKSRSFQNANMTYDQLIGTILKDYPGYNYTQCISKGRKIGKPLFQYKETDWNFLKRIASQLNSELFCDIMEPSNMFYFGKPIKANYEIEDKGYYKACKDLKKFYEAGGLEAGHDTDYFYYEIKRREKYEVGDKIRFKNKDFYVNQYSAYALKDEVIYKYRLCRKNGIWQTKMYNSLLSGGSLEGKVLAVEGEKVKLNLDIDKGKSKEAAWFPYAPPTGNTMYSMPIVGTSAALYFPNESSEAPIVTGCVRKNGSSCAKTSDTTKRYFGTEHGSEIEMTPGALNISGGSKEPLNISFDDNTGVTLKSPKKLSLNADGEILIKTPQNISIKAESQILVAKAGTQSGFSIENEFHFSGDNVIKNGSDRETYSPFNDEPKAAQKPEEKPKQKEEKKKEKKGFSWGKLAKGVLAGLAVVAVVAVVAAAVAFTAGTAIPAVAGALAAVGTTAAAVATTVGVGAAIAGTAAVASQAVSDKMSEEVSDASAYMWAGGRESFIGAVSGAIFGPFGTLKTLGGKMLFGGVTNGFESMVRQTLDGQGINFTTTLFDVGIGAATAGMFHKVEKVFKKASPWVKKGASKVNDAIENAVNKFKNMSDNFSSRFGNKLAFEGIGGFNGNSPINNVKLKPTRTQIAYNEAIKETKEAAENQMKKATSKGSANPEYTTTIKWGINNIEARPFGEGFWGKRIPQKNPRVDNFELKINPNNESFYLPHPKGGYVQFENLAGDMVQDGKLIMKQKSFYHVEDLPKFAQDKVIKEAMRQIESSSVAGYKVEWLVSDEKAVEQLTRLFKTENIDITVRYYPE